MMHDHVIREGLCHPHLDALDRREGRTRSEGENPTGGSAGTVTSVLSPDLPVLRA